MTEYLFDGALRWSFGFDNPNKAAVLFACLLPLLWIVWDWSWQKSRPFVTTTAALTGLAAFTALCLTYSRGGLVAATAAFAYLAFRHRKSSRPRARLVATVAILLVAIGILAGTGLATRSVDPITSGDASVGNRLTLWKGALAMAADRPFGFGKGNSGHAYMQWFQPLDHDAGYRTMVSGYLTPLVEYGWPLFALFILILATWWAWADPRASDADRPNPTASGLRASILAFAIAALFSTITESWVLWILPLTAAAILTCKVSRASSLQDRANLIRTILPTTLLAATALLALSTTGLLLSAAAPLTVTFGPADTITLRPHDSDTPPIAIVPDTTILGPTYGHLLREMALNNHVTIQVSPTAHFDPAPTSLILFGSAVALADPKSTIPTTLVCPSPLKPPVAHALLTSANIRAIHLAQIDEDRRGQFWRQNAPPDLIHEIPGVGNRIDWAWSELSPDLISAKNPAVRLTPIQ
jgi:hypothetical protein